MHQALALKHKYVSYSWKLRIFFNSLFNGTGLIYLNFIRLYGLSQLADVISSLQACESDSLLMSMLCKSVNRLAYNNQVV